jgi:hypothetical protein
MTSASAVLARLTRAGPSADLGRLPLTLNLRAVSIAEGVRAALSVAVIIALSDWLAQPLLLAAALGSLLTCMADVGGPIRRRVPVLRWEWRAPAGSGWRCRSAWAGCSAWRWRASTAKRGCRWAAC